MSAFYLNVVGYKVNCADKLVTWFVFYLNVVGYKVIGI